MTPLRLYTPQPSVFIEHHVILLTNHVNFLRGVYYLRLRTKLGDDQCPLPSSLRAVVVAPLSHHGIAKRRELSAAS
jgi:hypothetical protein